MKKFIPDKKSKKGTKPVKSVKHTSDDIEVMHKVHLSEDGKLEALVPLFVDIIGKLLAAKGMLRYRKDFIDRVKEIMEGGKSESGKKEKQTRKVH